MTRVKRNPCLGWGIFKTESKQMRDLCFLKFGNTVKTRNRINIVIIMIDCIVVLFLACASKFGFHFSLLILYNIYHLCVAGLTCLCCFIVAPVTPF
jgi:hypothetical protein